MAVVHFARLRDQTLFIVDGLRVSLLLDRACFGRIFFLHEVERARTRPTSATVGGAHVGPRSSSLQLLNPGKRVRVVGLQAIRLRPSPLRCGEAQHGRTAVYFAPAERVLQLGGPVSVPILARLVRRPFRLPAELVAQTSRCDVGADLPS